MRVKIEIKEQLDETWSNWFDNLNIKCKKGHTCLIGDLTDQCALHGVIARIRDLNLNIISVDIRNE